jgi:hypothetical protein
MFSKNLTASLASRSAVDGPPLNRNARSGRA